MDSLPASPPATSAHETPEHGTDPSAWTDAIGHARERIAPYLGPTPLVESSFLSRALGRRVLLKLESQQPVGAFKVRPAFNSILADIERCRSRGVVTNSSGNFAQAVAYAATRLGVAATIVMMRSASAFKRERTLGFGGKVALCDDTFSARAEMTERLRRESGRLLVHPYNSPATIAGNGTLGLELLDQISGDFILLVPISGGGLIAGAALAVKAARPGCRVFGVQAEANPSMKRSLEHGSPVRVEPAESMADALTVLEPGSRTFPIAQRLVEDVFLVAEDEMAHAIRVLALEQKLVVEAGGAVGVAAALARHAPASDLPLVCVVSGGNIAPRQLQAMLHSERGS